jgi:hypothetical protein
MKGILPKGSASATSHKNIGETLKSVDCLSSTIIDSAFLSSIRSLVTLYVDAYHCAGVVGCFFRTTDDDVKDLTAALFYSNNLWLGKPCCSNTCNTTFISPASISVLHCPDLTTLETHFNTQTIVGNMRRLLDGCAEAKCMFRNSFVGTMPLEVHGEDIQIIAMRLKIIFRHLRDPDGYGGSWPEVELRVKDQRRYW